MKTVICRCCGLPCIEQKRVPLRKRIDWTTLLTWTLGVLALGIAMWVFLIDIAIQIWRY